MAIIITSRKKNAFPPTVFMPNISYGNFIVLILFSTPVCYGIINERQTGLSIANAIYPFNYNIDAQTTVWRKKKIEAKEFLLSTRFSKRKRKFDLQFFFFYYYLFVAHRKIIQVGPVVSSQSIFVMRCITQKH